MEQLCVMVYKHELFSFTEKEFPLMDRNPGTIYPGSMHLFQLWDCSSQQWQVGPLGSVLSYEFGLIWCSLNPDNCVSQCYIIHVD